MKYQVVYVGIAALYFLFLLVIYTHLNKIIEKSDSTFYKKDGSHVYFENKEQANFENGTVMTTGVLDRHGGNIMSKNLSIISKETSDFKLVLQNIYVYSVFLDQRKKNASIRLVVTAPRSFGFNTNIFCHVFSDGTKKIYHRKGKKILVYETCESHLSKNSAYILSCPLSAQYEDGKTNDKPNKIILSHNEFITYGSSEFDSEIKIVRIVKEDPGYLKNSFAVCIPPLFGDISHHKLVEFIELSRILGAEHFTFYSTKNSRQLEKVLSFYSKRGIVTVLPWNLPFSSNSELWYHGQSVSVWDCLLRNMNVFPWVLFNDLDEFLIPRSESVFTWHQLLDQLRNNIGILEDKIAAYSFQSAYYFRNSIAAGFELQNFTILNHNVRTLSIHPIRTKLLVKPWKVFEIGIHHLSKSISDQYIAYKVDPKVAIFHHYQTCKNSRNFNCQRIIMDNTALKYSTSLMIRITDILKFFM